MFGRKKRERIISDWASLQDALIGNFDAEETGTGAMQVKVEWKAEGRSQDVTIAYAVAPEIGQRIDEAVHQLVSEVLHAPATSAAATGRFAPVPFSQVRCSV